MTNTEAKKILESYIACESKKAHFECSEYNCDDSCPLLYEMGTVGEFNEAINMGIKALEQEPCDAISRQAVKEQMIKYGFHAPDMTVTEFVEDLPSVKPQEKTGHWILVDEESNTWKCTNCIKEGKDDWWQLNHGTPHDNKMHYCPHCGAKMEVEQNG